MNSTIAGDVVAGVGRTLRFGEFAHRFGVRQQFEGVLE